MTIHVTLKVQTKKYSTWPLKLNLQIEDKGNDVLEIKRDLAGWKKESSLEDETKKLVGNYTLKNIRLSKSSTGKGEKVVEVDITFKSPNRKNFGKPNPDVEVAPVKIKLTQNWQLDENQHTNDVVGAVLEPLETLPSKIAEINVISGCQNPEKCNCDMAFNNLSLTFEDEAEDYVAGNGGKMIFELLLENSGFETSLNNWIIMISESKLPNPQGAIIANFNSSSNQVS